VPNGGTSKDNVPIHGRELGRRLRAAQKAARLTGLELSRAIGASNAKVSRILTGVSEPNLANAAAILALCRIVGTERDEILDLCHPRHDSAVLRLSDGTQWDAFLYHARQAIRLIEYQPLVIPWLVQDQAYNGAYHTVPDQQRRPWSQKLNHGPAIDLLAGLERTELLVHEFALRAPIVNHTERSAQMHKLLTVSSRRKVTLRVIPQTWAIPIAALSGFTILEYKQKRTLLYREDPTGAVFVDDPNHVAVYGKILDQLRRAALTGPGSRFLIEQIRDEPAPVPEPEDPFQN
jgi:transcriptional regulator with XRE-family HTH domain